MSERLVTQEELLKICPFSRATIWRWEQKGEFPKRRRISRGRIGWLYSEIEKHLTNLPKAK